jgi:hypothetical protein
LAARRISLGVTGFFLAATSPAPPYGCFAFPSGCSRLRFLWLWRSPPPLAMARRWSVRGGESAAVGGAGFFLRSLAETRVYGQGAPSTGAMCPWARLLGLVQKARPVRWRYFQKLYLGRAQIFPLRPVKRRRVSSHRGREN